MTSLPPDRERSPAGRATGRRSRWRWLWWLPALALLLVFALAGALAWLAGTDGGTRWILAQAQQRIPGLVVEDVQGRLLGDFGARRLRYEQDGLRIEVDDLTWQGLRLQDLQREVPWLQVRARLLQAGRVAVQTAAAAQAPAPPSPPALPALPVGVAIERVHIDSLSVPGLTPALEGVGAALTLGRTHRLDDLSLRWQGVSVEGMAELDAGAALRTVVRLAARAEDAAVAQGLPEWARGLQMDLHAAGPLERLSTRLSLQQQAQTLEATAELTPFEPLPLTRLQARFDRLDLARLLAPFDAPAPTTELSGQATLQLDEREPMSVALELRNGVPGAWDAGRLPVRSAVLRARGQGLSWEVQDSRWELAQDGGASAGELRLDGQHDPGRLQVRAVLEALRPAALDARLPAMQLAGPLQLDLQWPSDGMPAAFQRAELSADLTGALLRGPQAAAPPVRLQVQATLTPEQLSVPTWRAQAGDARMEGQVDARLEAGRWITDARLAFQRFDPAQWLPGAEGSAWRRGRHALNGEANVRARLPQALGDAAAWPRELDGEIELRLTDSLLLDQPLDLDLSLHADGAGALEAKADLLGTGNAVRLDAALHWPQPGASVVGASDTSDRVSVSVQAPALHRIGPLAAWLGQAGPVRGALDLDAQAVGPIGAWLQQVLAEGTGKRAAAALTWPLLSTEGEARVAQVQFGEWRLDSLQARWQADLRDAARLDADVQLRRLRAPGLDLPEAGVQASGTLENHRIALSARLEQAGAPTGASANAAAAAPDNGQTSPPAASRRTAAFSAAVSGTLRLPDSRATPASDALSWDGRIDELLLRLPRMADLPALLDARELPLRWRVAPDRVEAELLPGEMRVLDAPLRWSEARWTHDRDQGPRAALQAEVAPVAIAPWLRRVQPDFGWDGDLRLGARAALTATPEVTADIAVFRAGGDLRVREGQIVQALGLSAFDLRYQANQGVWRMTQRIVGQTLGRIEGSQTVRTGAAHWWPQDDAQVEGDLTVRVEQLAAWGAWVPAGWRLGGQVQAQARLSGRFGSPELVGDVRGRNLTARNAIEGVSLTDGEVLIDLQGDTASVQRVRFQGGDGHAEITGSARLGENPRAEMRLVAERFTLLGRVDRRVVISGSGDVLLDRERLEMKGRLRADEGLVDITRADAPRLSDDVRVRRPGQADPGEGDAGAAGAGERDIVLDLVFDPGERFRLRGRGLDTRLTGEMRLTTPRGRLAAHGEIRTDQGTFQAYGQYLEIERGVLTFVGDIGNPRLDIVAIRARTETRVGVTVSGSALTPRVRLFSDPEMPDTEKLALLITGRSYDNLGGAETLMLQRAALALLAGDGEGSAPNLPGILRLDEFSVRQTDGAVQDTVLAIGKQVSDRIYVGYERGLNATTGSWQLVYRIAQRFTLRAQSGDDSALDLIWIFHWD